MSKEIIFKVFKKARTIFFSFGLSIYPVFVVDKLAYCIKICVRCNEFFFYKNIFIIVFFFWSFY